MMNRNFQSIEVVVAQNYHTAAYLGHYLGKHVEIFTIDGKRVRYENSNVQLFSEQTVDLEAAVSEYKPDVVLVIEHVGFFELPQVEVYDLSELINICRGYRYICIDDLILQDMLAKQLNGFLIQHKNYANSRQGAMWAKIGKLNWPYSSELFEYFHKDFNSEVMPYLAYSKQKNQPILEIVKSLIDSNELEKLFQLLYAEAPEWVPSDFAQLKHLANFEVIEKIGENSGPVFLDKTLAQYISEPVLYIGPDPVKGIAQHLLYKPKYAAHEKWSSKQSAESLNLTRDTLSKEKLYANGQFSRLHATNEGLRFVNDDIHGFTKQCAKNEIIARVSGNAYSNDWKEDLLRSGIEYAKILKKAENLIANFLEIYNLYQNAEAVFDQKIGVADIDCVLKTDKEEAWIVLSWSNISYKSDVKIAYLAQQALQSEYLTKLYIVTTQKVIEVKIDARFEIKQKEATKSVFDDLFYWDA